MRVVPPGERAAGLRARIPRRGAAVRVVLFLLVATRARHSDVPPGRARWDGALVGVAVGVRGVQPAGQSGDLGRVVFLGGDGDPLLLPRERELSAGPRKGASLEFLAIN